ncbi:MAG: aldehyde dehydrogenase family protein [Bacteroidales bacterium]|nr:aldehyde dehydrogenase family protein [Bacteroidales bacterium]
MTGNTSTEKIDSLLRGQKEFFATGATRDIAFRKKQLRRFAEALNAYEDRITAALWADLHKSYEEAYLTEIALVRGEIRNHLRHVGRWARREHKPTPITMFPSSSYIIKEPLGTTLIVSPWNYPVQLLLNPLVGAISAGCTAILKPSPYVPEVSAAIADMVAEFFDEKYIAVVQGNREVNGYLFKQRFDLIFFTGSPALARKLMADAAENLVPLVLELGGKSPCIISRDADIALAAKRVAWGKTLNSGQTCIAPDYILIHEDVRDEFVREFGKALKELHGEDIHDSAHYVRMVNDRAWERVNGYMENGEILYGGRSIREERFIEPTLLGSVAPDSPVMTEEVFGPVFPVVTLKGEDFLEQAAAFVNGREKPLAFYWFGKESEGWEIISRTSSGGGCINDTIMHIVNDKIPFGGVGNSGMGHYHDRLSFEAFTHRRSIVVNPTFIDLPFRYMPYKFFALAKKLM